MGMISFEPSPDLNRNFLSRFDPRIKQTRQVKEGVEHSIVLAMEHVDSILFEVPSVSIPFITKHVVLGGEDH